MQHPWVSGSAWMALAPDMSPLGSTRAVLEASPEYRDLVESMAHPLASYNAEEVAAVVFPEMADRQGGWARAVACWGCQAGRVGVHGWLPCAVGCKLPVGGIVDRRHAA